MGVPLLLKDQALGVLGLTHATPGYYTRRHAELAMAMASHFAVAMDNARLYQQVREIAVAEERARIAREMHDSLAQTLFYVNIQLEAARSRLQSGQTELAAEQLGQLAQAVRDAYTDVREDILALRTGGAGVDLPESLSTYLPLWQEQSGVHAELAVSPAGESLPTLSATAQVQLVRIVQEALANVRKHARARQVQIRIRGAAGEVIVEVEDDGVGFDPAVRRHGVSPRFGLAMMGERAGAVGGALEIDSAPGRGTRVRVRLPAEATPLDAPERD
jgi:signal transduction histidine kinase